MTSDAAEILEVLQAEIRSANSPWASRIQAAAYCGGCSPRTIDDAANEGKFKRYWRGDYPVFKKSDLDRWMETGMKPKRKLHWKIARKANTHLSREIERASK